MVKRKLVSTILIFVLLLSMLLGCGNTQPDSNIPDDDNNITQPDDDSNGENNGTQEPGDNNQGENDSTQEPGNNNPPEDNTPDQPSGDNGGNNTPGDGENDNTSGDGENVKIDLPDDYVITMSDMERFLLTKDEQYPITNQYVELYQQASGGYIDNAKKAGLVVDKAQHLPSQKWHYFQSWLYTTIEEGMSWDASASDRSYGKFSCPELLLWIIEATGVATEKVIEAKDIAIAGKEEGLRVQTICANIRAAVPFNTYLRPIIIEFLENNPANTQEYNVTVNTDSAYEISSLKDKYIERETVTFTILMLDDTKQIDKVTVNGDVLTPSSGTTYKFSMRREDVSIVITLKDKESVTPPAEATNGYYYDIDYELPGKTAVKFEDEAQAHAIIKFNGTEENIIVSVSEIINISGGGRGGSGDNIWYSGDMLKIGTTSVNGSITIELSKNVKGIIITGYVTNNGCKIRVGDSDSTDWTDEADDGKTTLVTAKDDYQMNIAGKDTVAAGATSTITITFDSTDSITIATEKTGYVLYITAIEFIVDEEV